MTITLELTPDRIETLFNALCNYQERNEEFLIKAKEAELPEWVSIFGKRVIIIENLILEISGNKHNNI